LRGLGCLKNGLRRATGRNRQPSNGGCRLVELIGDHGRRGILRNHRHRCLRGYRRPQIHTNTSLLIATLAQLERKYADEQDQRNSCTSNRPTRQECQAHKLGGTLGVHAALTCGNHGKRTDLWAANQWRRPFHQ
jgi:hypothetical protein